MRFLAVSIAALALAAAASAQPAPTAKKKSAPAAAKAKTVPHAAPTNTGSAKSSVSKSAASKKSASKTGSKAASRTSAKPRRTAARRPPSQQQPTPDRYKEIQQALAVKGYFQGPVDGAWNAGSVEALKRFQKDQNLDPDGKIGSLALMALGLGPKRGVSAAPTIKSGSEPLPEDPPPVTQPQP